MKRILVTGAAGFLGSNLCRKLVSDKQNYVIALDNLITGRLVNLSPLLNKKNFEFIEHDIQNPIKLQVDEIYNAACPASPPHYQKSPTNTTKTCILGIINMLELATENAAKLLQFSTSEVYGDPLVHPQPESYRGSVNPIGIRSCYDEGKRCAESLCFDYNREFHTKIKIVRLFNTYGPNMDPNDGRVVSNMIIQALQNKNLTIYGDGTQTRSFCYVDDLIEALIKMMESPDSFMGPVNLGNPGEYTMIELAEKIKKLSSSHSSIVYLPLPLDDPKQRKPDISLAKTTLLWEPKISLDRGILATIEYFKSII